MSCENGKMGSRVPIFPGEWGSVEKIAMDFSCPCSEVLYFKPTFVGQVLYRQAEIWVWNTRGKSFGGGSRGPPNFMTLEFFSWIFECLLLHILNIKPPNMCEKFMQ